MKFLLTTFLFSLSSIIPASGCDLCAVYNASAARGETSAGFHVTLAEQFTHSKMLQEEGSEIHDSVSQYRYGNELSLSGGPGFYLVFKEETTLSLQSSFNYESKARDRIGGEKRDDGIVTAWYAGPGIVFTHGERFSATLNLDLPLDIYSRAFQTVPDYRLRAGVSWSF